MLVATTSAVLVLTAVLDASTAPLLEVVRASAPWFPLLAFVAIALFSVINSALINMMMASRLLYGMAHEHLVPRQFGLVHQRRRTPWVAILFTSLLGVGLVASLDISVLGGTTSLPLIVFTVVNIAVLVLRRDPVEHEHFRVPTPVPVLGAVSCAFFASPPHRPRQHRVRRRRCAARPGAGVLGDQPPAAAVVARGALGRVRNPGAAALILRVRSGLRVIPARGRVFPMPGAWGRGGAAVRIRPCAAGPRPR